MTPFCPGLPDSVMATAGRAQGKESAATALLPLGGAAGRTVPVGCSAIREATSTSTSRIARPPASRAMVRGYARGAWASDRDSTGEARDGGSPRASLRHLRNSFSFIFEHLRNIDSKASQRAVDPCLGRFAAHAKHATHVVERQVEVVAQDDGDLHLRRQPVQSAAHGDRRFLEPRWKSGLGGWLRQLEDRPPSVSASLPAFVGDDGQEPGAKVRAIAKARKGSPGLEGRLLHRVLAVVRVLQHAEGEALGDRNVGRQRLRELPVVATLHQDVQRRHSTYINAATGRGVARASGRCVEVSAPLTPAVPNSSGCSAPLTSAVRNSRAMRSAGFWRALPFFLASSPKPAVPALNLLFRRDRVNPGC